MALVLMESKQQVRTPEQMAKAAMKQVALKDMRENNLETSAQIRVTYMGIHYDIEATPTVNLENGQVLFHFGANGKNRLGFEPSIPGTDKSHKLSFGLGGNVMTGLCIDKDALKRIREQYKLTAIAPPGDSDAVLSEGETVE